MRVDLNADVGESATSEGLSAELALFPFITSINVACGAHAGDEATMRLMLEAGREARIAVGAHPGYPDRAGRGRRALELSPSDVARIVADQVRLLDELAGSLGVLLRHVKPHGALYNQAAADPVLAAAIADGARRASPRLRLVGLAGSALLAAGTAAGLAVAAEGFLDRGYRPDGTLVPRTEPGALITDAGEAAAQALALASRHRVRTSDGTWRTIAVDTLCVHGDTPGAASLARRVRAELEAAGVEVRPL